MGLQLQRHYQSIFRVFALISLAALVLLPAAQAQHSFAHGAVVALQGTPHLWIADEQGTLHWGGDTRALAGKHVNWSDRTEVSLDRLRSLPVGDPWLSAGLLKDGDPIYLVKWESDWAQPQLLHIQSIADVELFGINGSNYGNFVLDKATWEQRFGISAAALQRGVLPAAVSAPSAAAATVVPAPSGKDAVTWEITTCRGRKIGSRVSVTISGTLHAHAYVYGVRIKGEANGKTIDGDTLRSLKAGQSRRFNLYGSIITTDASSINCNITATPVSPPPASPTNVQVSREGSSLLVSWDPVSGATHYKVYHGGIEIATGPGTTYIDTDRLSARPPSRPSFIKVVGRSSNSLTVEWRGRGGYSYQVKACNSGGRCSNLSKGGVYLLPHQLHRSFSPRSGYTSVAAGLTDSRHVDQGLEPNTVYYYRVSACTDFKCSDLSDQTGGVTEAAGPVDAPSSPTGFRGEKVDVSGWTDDARVAWNAVAGATHYEVYQDSLAPPASRSYRLDAEISAPQTRYYDGSPNEQNLIFGWVFVTTNYKVRACNKAGCSDFSAEVTIR